MSVVYKNWEFHLSHDEVEFEVWEFFRFGEIISDACAQTIAAQWHSPDSPRSVMLSHQGAVTDDMSIEDFASLALYDASDVRSRDYLDALAAYITYRQKTRN